MIIHSTLEHVCSHAVLCFSVVLTYVSGRQACVTNFAACVGQCWLVTGFHPWSPANIRSSFCSRMYLCSIYDSSNMLEKIRVYILLFQKHCELRHIHGILPVIYVPNARSQRYGLSHNGPFGSF